MPGLVVKTTSVSDKKQMFLNITVEGGISTTFELSLSDRSVYGNGSKEFRANYNKCCELLAKNKVHLLSLNLVEGDDFIIGPPTLSLRRDHDEIKDYCKKVGISQPPKEMEISKLEVDITVPHGEAVKIVAYRIGLRLYAVNNDGPEFITTENLEEVKEATGLYF